MEEKRFGLILKERDMRLDLLWAVRWTSDGWFTLRLKTAVGWEEERLPCHDGNILVDGSRHERFFSFTVAKLARATTHTVHRFILLLIKFLSFLSFFFWLLSNYFLIDWFAENVTKKTLFAESVTKRLVCRKSSAFLQNLYFPKWN